MSLQISEQWFLSCHLTSLMVLKRFVGHFFSNFPVMKLELTTSKFFIAPNGNCRLVLSKLILVLIFNLIPYDHGKHNFFFFLPNIMPSFSKYSLWICKEYGFHSFWCTISHTSIWSCVLFKSFICLLKFIFFSKQREALPVDFRYSGAFVFLQINTSLIILFHVFSDYIVC